MNKGTANCETPAMRAATSGLNVIDYLNAFYGFEIDAHQEGGVEEGQDNYADVRWLAGILTTSVTDNIGGMVWDDPAQFARLANGEPGRLYPHFTWYPEVITLAVSHSHHTGDFNKDDISSGVWRPKGANTNFWTHDANERMICIGAGEHCDWGDKDYSWSIPQFVKHLVDARQAGLIPSDKMYTATLAVPQSIIFDAGQHYRLTALLDELAPYVQAGQAQYVTYAEAVEIWNTRFGAQPNVYHRAGLPSGLVKVETSAITSITESAATVSGSVTSDFNLAVTARGVCWGASAMPTVTGHHAEAGVGVGSFTGAVTGLLPGTAYYVRAYASTAMGTAYGEALSFTSTPATPTGVSASKGTYSDKVQVSWNESSGATSYQVWRNTADNSAAAVLLGHVSVNSAFSYSDSTIAPATTYYYWVKAVNIAGTSAFSAVATGYPGVVGPLVSVNGMIGDNVVIATGTPLTIAVAMMNLPAGYIGHDVDWWVAAYAHTGRLWFYLNDRMIFTPFDGNLANMHPAYAGPLMNLASCPVARDIPVAPGTYNVWFVVDYPMDGVLHLTPDQYLMSRVTVVVE